MAFDSLIHGSVLCKKAKVLHMANRPQQAMEVLEKAKSLAVKINRTETAELDQKIAELELLLRPE